MMTCHWRKAEPSADINGDWNFANRKSSLGIKYAEFALDSMIDSRRQDREMDTLSACQQSLDLPDELMFQVLGTPTGCIGRCEHPSVCGLINSIASIGVGSV